MNTLVIDSSVIVKWLNVINEQNLEQADEILKEVLKDKVELITPELAKYEIGNVLLLKKKLPTAEIALSIHALYSYPIQFITESEELARETYKLAFDLGVTYYDASFLALAKQYEATLITENIKHHGRALDIKVVSLKDY